MTIPAIRTEDLTKHFGRVRALQGLNLEVARGEIFGFLGANGAGKTTTIRLLLDLLRPTRGRALVNGFDCRRESRQARASLGYLPGEMPVYPDIDGRQLIAFLASLQPERPDASWVETLQRRFDLSDAVLSRRLVELSHGMKQKVGLVQALMGRPPLVVLDEPTVGLDPKSARLIKDILRQLAERGAAVFLSTHILEIAERMCDRIGIINRGQLIAIGTMDELRSAGCGQALYSTPSSLEDIFLSLTGGAEAAEIAEVVQ